MTHYKELRSNDSNIKTFDYTHKEDVFIYINAVEFEAEVYYTFDIGEPQIIRADPNDCCEGSDDLIEIHELYAIGYDGVAYCVDFLIPMMKESLSEQIIENIGEDLEGE